MAGILPRANSVGPSNYRIARAKIFYIPEGSSFAYDLGNVASFAATFDLTKSDFNTLEDGVSVPDYSDVTTLNPTISFEARNYQKIIAALSNLSEEEEYVQLEAVDQTITMVGAPELGQAFETGKRMVTPKTLKAGAVTFVLDTHYKFDNQAGLGKFIAFPDGFVGGEDDIVLTFDQAAYTGVRFGGFSRPNGLRGALLVRDTNPRGPKYITRFHIVDITPDGDQNFLSEDELSSRTFTGTMTQDPTRPANFGFYDAIELPRELA